MGGQGPHIPIAANCLDRVFMRNSAPGQAHILPIGYLSNLTPGTRTKM
jgi:hypothetical protein